AVLAGCLAASALFFAATPVGEVAGALRVDLARPAAADAELATFYGTRDFKPLWTGWRGVRPEAKQLVDLLATADRDGLRPSDYRPRHLRALIAGAEQGDAKDLAEAELALSRAYAAYAGDLRRPLPE